VKNRSYCYRKTFVILKIIYRGQRDNADSVGHSMQSLKLNAQIRLRNASIYELGFLIISTFHLTSTAGQGDSGSLQRQSS